VGAKLSGDGCIPQASRRRKIGIKRYLLVSISGKEETVIVTTHVQFVVKKHGDTRKVDRIAIL